MKNKQQAIGFLQITEETFNYFDAKSLILYTLKNGQRWYSEEVLCKFRDSILNRRREMQNINKIYADLLYVIAEEGDKICTRNAETFSHITLERTTFTDFPLITTRKVAWKKAIKEMEWFMSGDEKCPEDLLDWWDGQLNEDNLLVGGYSKQFRRFDDYNSEFDQVDFILTGLKTNPNSRRLLLTVWHPGDMAYITKQNNNLNTPTCCHSIVVQFFVRDKKLHMKTYQRSADMLLGVPHNWVQSWAMLLYFAYHSNLEIGGMTWDFGDAHIYNEESHIKTTEDIINSEDVETDIKLIYSPKEIEYDKVGVPIFKTSDFYVDGNIPEPTVLTKPKLL